MCNLDMPTVCDADGNLNNVLDIRDKSQMNLGQERPVERIEEDLNNEIVDQINDVDDLLDSLGTDDPHRLHDLARLHGYFQKETLKLGFAKSLFDTK